MSKTFKEDITKRLLEACNGHKHAKIPWPHRLLHEAHDHILKLQEEVERLKEAFDTAHNTNLYLQAQLQSAKKEQGGWVELRKLVDEQAEDDALWCIDVPITEAYHQQELRKLHTLIEKLIPPPLQKPSEGGVDE